MLDQPSRAASSRHLRMNSVDHSDEPSSSSSSSGSEASPPQSTGTSRCTSQHPSKPMIERRRRARINEYLSELKLLIMDDLQEQPGRLSKLDKAELLELVVDNIKRKQKAAEEKRVADLYRMGVNECAWSVQHFLSGCDDVSPDVRIRLLNHLATWQHHNCENQSPGGGGGGAFNPFVPGPIGGCHVTATAPAVTNHRGGGAMIPGVGVPHHLFQMLANQIPASNVRDNPRIPSLPCTPEPAGNSHSSLPSGGKMCSSRGRYSSGTHPYHNANFPRRPLVDRNNNCLPDTTTDRILR